MTANARELLAAFDALPPPDKHEVATEILRRSTGVDNSEPIAPVNQTIHRGKRPLIQLPPGSEPLSEQLIRERR